MVGDRGSSSLSWKTSLQRETSNSLMHSQHHQKTASSNKDAAMLHYLTGTVNRQPPQMGASSSFELPEATIDDCIDDDDIYMDVVE